jgi:hypothetical protein
MGRIANLVAALEKRQANEQLPMVVVAIGPYHFQVAKWNTTRYELLSQRFGSESEAQAHIDFLSQF